MQADLVMYTVMRGDLGLSADFAGKLIGQGMHAAASAFDLAPKELQIEYHQTTLRRKIVLEVDTEADLFAIQEDCRGLGVPHYLVTDMGLTGFDQPTVTCLGIGPVLRSTANKRLKLRMLRLYRSVK